MSKYKDLSKEELLKLIEKQEVELESKHKNYPQLQINFKMI